MTLHCEAVWCEAVREAAYELCVKLRDNLAVTWLSPIGPAKVWLPYEAVDVCVCGAVSVRSCVCGAAGDIAMPHALPAGRT